MNLFFCNQNFVQKFTIKIAGKKLLRENEMVNKTPTRIFSIIIFFLSTVFKYPNLELKKNNFFEIIRLFKMTKYF